MPEIIPQSGKDLLSKLLVLDPKNRLGAMNISDMTQHEFFL